MTGDVHSSTRDAGQDAMKMPSTLTLRAIALASLCDERTVRRFYRGERVRESSAERIRRAIALLGIEDLASERSTRPAA